MANFKSLWTSLSRAQKQRLAKDAITSVNYLSQVAHSHRRAGISLISRLVSADDRINAECLRPELSFSGEGLVHRTPGQQEKTNNVGNPG